MCELCGFFPTQVLAVQGELKEAVKHLQKALELSPHEKVGDFFVYTAPLMLYSTKLVVYTCTCMYSVLQCTVY